MHFRIVGKGDKMRYVPVATNTQRLMQRHLEVAEHGFCVHTLLATAATNALAHTPTSPRCKSGWGYANMSKLRINENRKCRPEESLTFKVE